ncbi:hypothetical protein F2Q70_00029512 [Brassica cretica]|uniref:Uncharacterized protein n=1 Tax=Brassica cretica TaxID=69181 RepID=A0A8S9FCE3_BRACR|nr:hypothetical protein F2Q70_00029512 [Brassica cretica]
MRWFTMLLLMCLASLSQTQTLLKYTEIPVMGVDYGCKVIQRMLIWHVSYDFVHLEMLGTEWTQQLMQIWSGYFDQGNYMDTSQMWSLWKLMLTQLFVLRYSRAVSLWDFQDVAIVGSLIVFTILTLPNLLSWVENATEKGGNRYHSYRTNHRGDNGGLRHMSSRFDRSRGYNAEENPRFPREVRRGMSPRVGAAVEAREEGEIPQQEKRQTTRNDQEKTRESVVDPTIILTTVQKVTLESQNVENGLDVINDLLEEGNNEVVDDNMVLDENQSNVLGIVEGSDDGFLNLSDGEVEKKTVVRKGLFKQTAVAGASSKARNIQAIISTRKRATNNTKPATRQGEGAKHHEEKGPSNPKPTSSKS